MVGQCLVSAGCGPDLKPFYDESLAIKQALVGELKSITDAESAATALPALETIEARYQAWEASIQGVVFTIEDAQEHKARLDPAKAALKTEAKRVDQVLKESPDLRKRIKEICAGPRSQ